MKITLILQRREPGEVRACGQCHIVVSKRTGVDPKPVCVTLTRLHAPIWCRPSVLQTPHFTPAVHPSALGEITPPYVHVPPLKKATDWPAWLLCQGCRHPE